MGRETRCIAEVGDWVGQGRLHLETDALVFRGAKRTTIPLTEIRSAVAEDGWLVIAHPGGTDRFDLGNAAASWARAITHPKSRIDKLDVKPTSRVALVDVDDTAFLDELRARTPHVEVSDTVEHADVIFYRVDEAVGLERLPALRERIAPAGAVWLIHPKGHAELKHEPIVAAARRAGLIDTKTARFSDTCTALKLVIPRELR